MRKEPKDVVGSIEILHNMSRAGRTDQESARAAALQSEAAAWLSLLSSGTATTADGEALKRWCLEDPAHAEAYAKMARVWGMLATVTAQVPNPALSASTRPVRARSVVGRRAFLGGAVAAAAAGYAIIHPPFGLWPSLAEFGADIRTGTGERRRVELADDVAVDLNTRSSLTMRAAPGDTPQIELISGEAVVVTKQKDANACVVIAGAGRVVARDAKFDVRHDAAQVRVVCLDGNVRVEHRAEAVTLAARQQVIYDERGIGGSQTVDPALVVAWQEGRLVFRKEPLSHVIDEVNRYRPGRIVLMDRKLGERLIDASFRLGGLDNVVIYIQQAFNARITRLPGGVILVG